MQDNPRRMSGRTAIISAIVVVVLAVAGFLGLRSIVDPMTGNVQASRVETGDGTNCQANCTGNSTAAPAEGTAR